MNSYNYYERRYMTVMVPIRVNYYSNIGMVCKFDPPQMDDVEPVMKHMQAHNVHIVRLSEGEELYGMALNLHKEELHELAYTLKYLSSGADDSMRRLYDRIKEAAKGVIDL